MKALKKCLFALSAMACVATANAGSIANAKVVALRVDQDGRGMVIFDKPVSGSPTCINAASYANALAFDAKTPGGKAILAFAMQVKSLGTVVTVYATGTCMIYGGANVEDWSYGVGG